MKKVLLTLVLIGFSTNSYGQTPDPCMFQLRTKQHYVAFSGNSPTSINGYGIDGAQDYTSIGLTAPDSAIYMKTTVVDEQSVCQDLDSLMYIGPYPSTAELYSYSDHRYEIISPDDLATYVDLEVELDITTGGIGTMTWGLGSVSIDGAEYGYEYDSGSGVRIYDESGFDYYGTETYIPETGYYSRYNIKVFTVEGVPVGKSVVISKMTWSDGGSLQEMTINDIVVRIVDSY